MRSRCIFCSTMVTILLLAWRSPSLGAATTVAARGARGAAAAAAAAAEIMLQALMMLVQGLLTLTSCIRRAACHPQLSCVPRL
jgi:hypothetical protein